MPRKYFDLLRNSHSTVPVYADKCELLVFGAFFNSLPACRKGFFGTQKMTPEIRRHFCNISVKMRQNSLSAKWQTEA